MAFYAIRGNQDAQLKRERHASLSDLIENAFISVEGIDARAVKVVDQLSVPSTVFSYGPAHALEASRDQLADQVKRLHLRLGKDHPLVQACRHAQNSATMLAERTTTFSNEESAHARLVLEGLSAIVTVVIDLGAATINGSDLRAVPRPAAIKTAREARQALGGM